MDELIHKDSLRAIYIKTMDDIVSYDHKSEMKLFFLKRWLLDLGSFLHLYNYDFTYYTNKTFWVMAKFICPHCYKCVLLETLSLKCPFCEKEYDAEKLREKVLLKVYKKDYLYGYLFNKIIYENCNNCGSQIQYIKCPHCRNPVDLFAPYDINELKRKRYEK